MVAVLSPIWIVLEEIDYVDAERFRNPIEHAYRRIAPAILNASQVGLVDLRRVGEIFLRQASDAPVLLHAKPRSFAHVHLREGRGWTTPGTIDYKS